MGFKKTSVGSVEDESSFLRSSLKMTYLTCHPDFPETVSLSFCLTKVNESLSAEEFTSSSRTIKFLSVKNLLN